jgi:hypothetical protein
MEQSLTGELIGRGRDVPRTDGWVGASLAIVVLSLIWTAAVFVWTVQSDPCASSGDQCVLVLAAMVLWIWGQIIVAPFQLLALGVLARYALRGNDSAPRAGLVLFLANCALSGLFYAYLTTLPFYFR